MLMVAFLSQYILIGSSTSTCNSFSRVLIHTSSQIPKVIAWFSTSALDIATTSCFLLLQVTKMPLQTSIKVRYPEVDLLSVIDLV